MQRNRNSAGYTLLELLAAGAIMFAALTLCGKLFVQTTRLSAANTGAMDRLNQMRELENEFIETVHEAVGVAARAASYRTSEDTLVLRLPANKGERRCAVFGALRRPDRITRMILHESGGSWEAESLTTFALPVGQLRFSWEGETLSEARLVRMHVGAADGLRPEKRVQRVLAACRGIER